MNKRTLELRVRAQEGIQAVADAGVMPLDIILKVMAGDTTITARQYEAARDAAPYLHPRLAAVDVKAETDGRLRVISSEPMSEDEWERAYGVPDELQALEGLKEPTQ